MSGGNGITRWRWGGGTMSGLAGQLSRVLGVHILDKTNIADQFVYTFEFSRGEDPQATETSVFAAVDEQLGLKLEKTKGPRGFIVIDAIERPTPDGPLVYLPARARGANVPAAAGTTSQHKDSVATPHQRGGQPQTFDVVSVKPCAPGASPGMRGGGAGGSGVSPGHISMSCHTPAYLIDLAYVYYADRGKDDPINAWIRRGQLEWVRGAPAWASTEQFMIEAKTAGATDRNVMLGSMLRAALEDRFKLKTHIETEQADMWTLTVGKGGPNFKAPVAGDCVALDGNRNPSREEFLANPNKPFCGKHLGNIGETASSWGFSAQTMAVLADTLGPELGAKVIDQTGLNGAFTFMLRYEPGDNIAASIASALDQQLGLKLTRTKGTRGFIVIDHIERPGPNRPAAGSVEFDSDDAYRYNMYHDKAY